MGRKVLLGLAVLVCAFAASNGRSTEAIGEFWTKETLMLVSSRPVLL